MGQHCNRRTQQSQRSALSCPPKCEFELTKDAPPSPWTVPVRFKCFTRPKGRKNRPNRTGAIGINRDQLPVQAKHAHMLCTIFLRHECAKATKNWKIFASLISTALTMSWKQTHLFNKICSEFLDTLLQRLMFSNKSRRWINTRNHLKLRIFT